MGGVRPSKILTSISPPKIPGLERVGAADSRYGFMAKGAPSIPLNINSYPDYAILNVDFCIALASRVEEFLLGLISLKLLFYSISSLRQMVLSLGINDVKIDVM